jgi:hypothetical protein
MVYQTLFACPLVWSSLAAKGRRKKSSTKLAASLVELWIYGFQIGRSELLLVAAIGIGSHAATVGRRALEPGVAGALIGCPGTTAPFAEAAARFTLVGSGAGHARRATRAFRAAGGAAVFAYCAALGASRVGADASALGVRCAAGFLTGGSAADLSHFTTCNAKIGRRIARGASCRAEARSRARSSTAGFAQGSAASRVRCRARTGRAGAYAGSTAGARGDAAEVGPASGRCRATAAAVADGARTAHFASNATRGCRSIGSGVACVGRTVEWRWRIDWRIEDIARACVFASAVDCRATASTRSTGLRATVDVAAHAAGAGAAVDVTAYTA